MRFTTNFVRTLAFFTITSLVGCDEIDDLEIDDLEADDSELDDTELRSGLPIAGIPSDDPPGTLAFSIPMQTGATYKPKLGFSLHGPTDLAYIWTQDPAGAPDAILTDLNGVSPYAENLDLVPPAVCNEFLQSHSYNVPITNSVQSCALIEKGCCDRICYEWGGWAAEENGQNMAIAVTHDTFDKEMVYGAFVEGPNPRLTWDLQQTNGGHSVRETACGCLCAHEVP